MGLKDLTIPEKTVKTPGGDITVRGLSLEDFTILAAEFGPTMVTLFEKFSGTMAEGGEIDFGTIGKDLLTSAAPLVAALIAHGAGEPESREVARKLPAPVQLEALEAIGILTVSVEGGLKKVAETVIRVAQASTSALTSLQAA